MPTVRIPGGREEGGGSVTQRRANGKLTVTRRSAVRVAPARGADAGAAQVKFTDEDVVALELEGGFRLWIRGDDFRKEFGAQAKRGVTAGEEEWELSPDLQVGSPERGMGTWLLKGLEVFGVDLTEVAASTIAGHVEATLERGPGLYACNLSGGFALKDLPPHLPTDRPLLVFLHGTASSTSGSFGGLWGNKKPMEVLARHYADAAFAFEHRTLTQSPIQNALDLVTALPKGARLHLVSHSRGGLLGELLCRGERGDRGDPFEGREKGLFADREQERGAIEALNTALKDKQIRVDRFVRVACPARGTTLASGRLGRWLSVMVNLLGQIPALQGNPLYEALTDFLLAVVKEGTDPKTLPGLESMMPDSPLIRVLNLPGVSVQSDLSVISGDIEEAGVWGKLKLLIPDLFYGGDHDLVVNTGSMYGGAGRGKGARFFLDQGPSVNHFHYFINEKTVQMLVEGLTRPDGSQAGFSPIEKARQEVPARAVRGAAGPRPVVFLIPGIMGTHLAVDGDRIWLDPFDLAFGGMGRLRVDATNVEAQALIAMAYGELVEYLSQTHEVVTFPFDWRLSIRNEAERLAKAVEKALDSAERANQPVRLMAHSMGGLVARAVIAQHPEIWRRICRHPAGRLIMLGTPNQGSYIIVKLLVGQEEMFRYLALLDITHSGTQLLEIISRYPGVLEMLPENGTPDFFSPAYWSGLKTQNQGEDWVLPDQKGLQDAVASRQLIRNSPIDPDRMLYVAGCAPATPCGLRISEKGEIEFLATGRGDGRVLWDTGIPAGVRTWYMEGVAHGDLANHEPAFPALLELLQSGQTARLPAAPPVAARGVAEAFPLPREVVPMLPDEDALAAAAVGSRRRTTRKAPVREVRVSITHGNLGYARHAVAVGHYQGDTIVGAEAYLDKVLQGRLGRRQQLGLYPGGLNTAEVILNPDPYAKPGGAIVIGLGRVGELSPGGLASTFARAALAYALAVAEAADTGFQTVAGVPRSAKISSLLIGTGAGGFSVDESVNAILRGVLKANTLLRESRQDTRVIIEELEFVELWRDLAIQAGRSLERVEEDSELRGFFECEAKVRQGQGGSIRVQWQDDPHWWHRLQIMGKEDGSLRFSALTERARAEVSLLPAQRALLDTFIQQAITSTARSPETTRTLFELLVPNRLKEQAPRRHNLVLILDEDSARYPWELLEDRWGDASQPMAVQAGLVRQLETAEYREQVRMTTQETAYVVGDPVSKFVALPGAEAEARSVAEQLATRGYTVERQIRAEARAIVTSLHARAYRIVHLAGHGVHEEVLDDAKKLACDLCGQPRPDKAGKKVSGMVIGDDIFLTPADVEQMRQVPELVFINCCHLGRTDSREPDTRRDDRHRLAANVAAEFIRMGVKAVVAAGWAVDDGAAKTFAHKFYDAMLEGVPFGEAVRLARSETYQRHPGVNTWGAYQCYGDPDYRLVVQDDWTGRAPEERPYVSSVEVAADLGNLTGEAKTAGDERLKALKARIDQILKLADQAWLKRGDVAAALGQAYGELGEFDKAIEHLGRAVQAEKAEFPVRAVEQRANFKSRWAVELFRSGQKPSGGVKPSDLIQEAVREVEALKQFGPTAERWSLLGSAHKRHAWIAEGDERKGALKSMASSYRKAHELAYAKGQGRLDTYPLLNWLAAEILLDWYGTPHPAALAQIEDWCQRAEAHASEREKVDPDFWNSVVKPECDLVRALARKTLDREKDTIVDGYRRAKSRGASPREFRSVLEHLEFLVHVATGAGPGDIQAQAEALRAITDQLSSVAG
ncbi:MAG TPA: CHAT domain-containing protein [Candidatus Methylomirabilis sp.]|nr:CHAT domain-containing protein [Candidatus Methylomirabilis sp.]